MEQLIETVADEMCATPEDEERIRSEVARAYIAFDDYSTDRPEYTGKVMSIVWSDGLAVYDVYIWHQGVMQSA